MFKIYRQNFLHYIYLAIVFFLFIIITQMSLNHWFNSKIDKLEDICLREFDSTPMIYYFNSNHKSSSIKVDWDVVENEGISELYKMKARYGWAVAKRDYETRYINTGYGDTIKAGMDSYFKNNPNIKINERDIENKIDEIIDEAGLSAIGMDYSVNASSYYVSISTVRTSDEDHKMVDYIFYSFD